MQSDNNHYGHFKNTILSSEMQENVHHNHSTSQHSQGSRGNTHAVFLRLFTVL